MHKKLVLVVAMIVTLLSLSGCAAIYAEEPNLYDLGAVRSTVDSNLLAGKPPISVAGVNVPNWLDSELMVYRLNYANQQQPRAYAGSRWAMSPGQLIAQQVKLQIAQAGGVVLSASDGTAKLPMLRIEVDDFSQHFEGPKTSLAKVALRATVFRGRTVLAQRSFEHNAPAPTPDAAGGAHAMAAATDKVLADLVSWLADLELK